MYCTVLYSTTANVVCCDMRVREKISWWIEFNLEIEQQQQQSNQAL